jgi:hypothetical protein
VQGKWRYSTIEEMPGSIEVPNLQGTFQTITRLSASEAVKVVGIHQAIDGNMNEQVQALKLKADLWGTKLKSGYLPRNLAHQGSTSMIWSSLRYPLPACTLTASQGDLITRELYKNLLPKLGANRNYPSVYRHAPASLQGLDIPLLYIEQEISHIRQVLTHGAIPTTTGTLMQISLEQAQLEVGLGVPFLETSFGFYGFLLTDIWWKAIWEFVWCNDITLTCPDQTLPQPQRTNDVFLMARLCSQSSLSPSELLSCNRCRLFLEAITLADITSGSG